MVVLVFIGQTAFSSTAWAAEPVPDVRILIDISGSMKHNDPHNLRAPALRLLTGLLPKGTRAGVWTYGQYVNMLVPLGEVDVATMASRRCPGLYLCGEILDVDGRVGGFNFQWAWCTGRLAGLHAARRRD